MNGGIKDDESELQSKVVGRAALYVAAAANFGTAAVTTFTYPFLPWMVKEFKINGEFVTSEETGYYAGLIGTVQFIGVALGSYFLGFLSDKFGRRSALLTGVVGVSIFSALFGLTNTSLGLAWAISCRFLTGLFNGLSGIVKSITADVSDNINQARRMTMVNCAFQLGMVVGPTVGGTLAQPTRQYPGKFSEGGFLDKFPFFLPSIVTAGIGCAIAILVFLKLPETSTNRRRLQNVSGVDTQEGISLPAVNDNEEVKLLKVAYNKKVEVMVNGSANVRDTNTTADVYIQDVSTALHRSDFDKSLQTDSEVVMLQVPHRVIEESLWSRMCARVKNSTAVELLKSADVRKALFLYAIVSFPVIGYAEMSNVWFATEKYRGGLEFSELEIGILTASTSVFLIPMVLFIVPRIERKLGPLQTFFFGSVALVFTSATFPVVASMTNEFLVWIMLSILQIPLRVFTTICFVMGALLVNNSVLPDKVGAVNGLNMAFSGLVRGIAPVSMGSLYAWSVDYGTEHIGFPFDYHLTFYFLALTFWLALCQAVRVPQHMNHMKLK